MKVFGKFTVAGMMLVIVACAAPAGQTAEPTAAIEPPKRERILRLDESPVGEIDPAKATDFADTVLMVNLYDTLTYPKRGTPGVDPLLAVDWKIEGNSYTFKLRDGVRFHSGNTLTSDDVVFSYNRLMTMGQGFSNLLVDRVDKVEAIDPLTVRFTLKAAYAPFLAALVKVPIVDSKTVMTHKKDGTFGEYGDYGAEWLSSHSAGTGAYMVENQNPQSETMMVKFPDHFMGFSTRAPDRVQYRYGMEAATVRAALSRGDHEISSLWLPPEVLSALAKEKGMALYSEGGATGEYVKLNTMRAPTDDVHCRQALTYAVDYAAALAFLRVNEQFSIGIPANGPIPSGMLGHDDSPVYAQDMERAKQELSKCKYKPSDVPLEIAWIAETPAREKNALLMKQNFEALGFKVNITKVPWALLTELVSKPETTPNAVEIAVGAVTPDTDSLVYNMYHSSLAGTWMSAEQLSDAKVDELLEKGRSEPDPDTRKGIYGQLNTRLKELAPTICLFEATYIYAMRDVVNVPALKDPTKRVFDGGFNLVFREIDVVE